MEKFKNLKLWQIIVIAIGIILLYNMFMPHKQHQYKSIPKDYVEIPETSFKTKEQVQEEFNQVGLKAKFVVTNFDDKAEKENESIIAGTTDSIDTTQPNIKYFSFSEYGDDSGEYAKKGSTLIVGYSDHVYLREESSSSSQISKSEQSSSTSVSSSSTDEPKNFVWYTDDSRYATMPALKKTVENQMQELGTDDPVYAIIVNDLQTYLSSVAEYDVSEISKSLSYDRKGLAITLKMDGESIPSDITDKISKDIQNTSGRYYTFL
ncbi:hypothetical protein [Lactococcus lactis]|uniref:hypothetical protein n=1 Tax=Lactococcus lactis TaxID=1358 RepID=UPI001911FD72|nr:hypothetical protein [Lactococcus lactis]WDA67656.1 hypothetical protein IL310_08820 [Lactococcus lactis]